MTDWSPQQIDALNKAAAWLSDPGGQQVFRLFGYAGTGKSTLAKHLAEGLNSVSFAAFTGKAAMVMRSKGCTGARTIHSLIYVPVEDEYGQTVMRVNPDSAAAKADLIIIDECSMVGEEIGKDLLSFRKPVLVLGDPAQLPPIRGAGFFTDHASPDVMLTEIHRQAADNPIVSMATDIRLGKGLSLGAYGSSRVIGRDDIDAGQVVDADQVLVGMNDTRIRYNNRIRSLKNYTAPLVTNERVVCLRNNRDLGIFNGGLYQVRKVYEPEDDKPLEFTIRTADTTDRPIKVKCWDNYFLGTEKELDPADTRKGDQFTYGYALTVHKSQGSQWNNVMVFDQSSVFKEHSGRWLYTAVTRAAEAVTVVRL